MADETRWGTVAWAREDARSLLEQLGYRATDEDAEALLSAAERALEGRMTEVGWGVLEEYAQGAGDFQPVEAEAA